MYGKGVTSLAFNPADIKVRIIKQSIGLTLQVESLKIVFISCNGS